MFKKISLLVSGTAAAAEDTAGPITLCVA